MIKINQQKGQTGRSLPPPPALGQRTPGEGGGWCLRVRGTPKWWKDLSCLLKWRFVPASLSLIRIPATTLHGPQLETQAWAGFAEGPCLWTERLTVLQSRWRTLQAGLVTADPLGLPAERLKGGTVCSGNCEVPRDRKVCDIMLS